MNIGEHLQKSDKVLDFMNARFDMQHRDVGEIMNITIHDIAEEETP